MFRVEHVRDAGFMNTLPTPSTPASPAPVGTPAPAPMVSSQLAPVGAPASVEPSRLAPAGLARAVVVCTDPALRAAVVRAGVVPVKFDPGADLVELAKRVLPHVMVIDMTDPSLVRDAERAARILSRCDETKSVQVVALAPSGFNTAWQGKMRGAGVFAVLIQPVSDKELTLVVDIAAGRSNEVRAKQRARNGRRTSLTFPVESNKSLLVRTIHCPFHDQPQPINRYILRSGMIITDTDFFDLPVYKSAARGTDFINFHQLNVIVCPRCLFSSNEPRYFRDPGEKSKPHVYNTPTRVKLREMIGERQQIAGELTDSFFTEHRTLEQALVANQLVLSTSKHLYDCNRYTMPIELVRMGNCHLRLACLKKLRPGGADTTDLASHYRAALDLLGHGFTTIEGAVLFKAVYQIVALAVTLGEDKIAYQYIARLNEMAREGSVTDKDEKAAMERYHLRCQQAWEDRDYRRLDDQAVAA